MATTLASYNMKQRRLKLRTIRRLTDGLSYTDIAFCLESQRIFVLRNDLHVEVYDLVGNYLGEIKAFADLFSSSEEAAVTNLPPLLTLAHSNLLIGDPLTGLVAAYSFHVDGIVFSRLTDVIPYAITGTRSRSEALVSCCRTGTVYRIETSNGEITPVMVDKCRPPLLCASSEGWATIDRSAAIVRLRKYQGAETNEITFLPKTISQAAFEHPDAHYVFGVDCCWESGRIVILHGNGGTAVPSLWNVQVEEARVDEFWIDGDLDPIRVACTGNGQTVLLCVKDPAEYFMTSIDTTA